MKTKRLFPVLMFLAGLITGGSLLAIFAFASPNPPPPVEITAAAARTYFQAYYANPDKPATGIKGYAIDLEQYNGMQQILLNDDNVRGFRVYKGQEGKLNVGIVVGIDSNGKELSGAKIYKSTATHLGPCPTVCDTESPISRD